MPRIERGELLPVLESSRPPSPAMRQPRGTESQIVDYYSADGEHSADAGGMVFVARVHRYLLPDGSIGGSGKPDPKIVKHDGRTYGLAKRTPP